MKQCSLCGELKSRDKFSKHPKTRDGLQSQCRDCQEASLARIEEKNKDFVLAYFLCHPCVDCGEGDPIVLDFDHVRGVKLCGVATLVHGHASIVKIKAEIAKCEVRCSNCHRRVTHKRRLAAMV